ncbi:MAG: glycosyltransferase family 2 protein [Lachnospiraceae bacterium]|nr:glycosyltransferase family 2 protein [Lachnospiraceae bacterium]
MKQVSIVIPVYNTGSLMYTCFNSLVNQTVGLDVLDIIVVDDGSTDEISRQIINEYVNKYPQSFKLLTKENGGQGSARNMAFPHCIGEYVTCLDSDDSFEPEWVEKMYKAAIENKADFVGCGYKAVRYKEGKPFIVRELDMRPVCKTNREMFIDADVCMFTTLFKRELLTASGAKYPEGHIYEDTAFFIELLPWIQHPVYIEEALSCRTLHEGSTMTNVSPKKVADIFPVFEALIDFYDSKGLRDDYRQELEYFIGKVLLCSSINRVGFVKHFKDRKQLVKMTCEFLHKHIPNYRCNPYIKGGGKGFYLKHYNSFFVSMVAEMLHIRFIIKKDYNV